VVYWEANGTEQSQRANAIVLCANGAETPRLLFMSETSGYPNGLANSSGMVGKNLMFNGYSSVVGLFDEPIHAYKSIPATRVVHDFWTLDENLGFYGGGGIDSRHPFGGNRIAAGLSGGIFGGPSWGSDYKKSLEQLFTHTCSFDGHTTSLPLASNNVTLDPEIQDVWGRPAIRCTYMDHADDIATMRYFMERSLELMDAAGATRTAGFFDEEGSPWSQHLLGTCRMGNDPDTSVVDRFNRSHDVPNLFMCDGSSMVTSSRGQPTMTIMALAFRTADYIIGAARRGEI
jgi:choline dehydrogenase-like flavoprotein